MKNYFIISITRVLPFIGNILGKIHRGILEKSIILSEESILPHSNGIYYGNSHVHLWTHVIKRIRIPTLSEQQEKQVLFILFMNKILFRKSTTKQQQRKHLGFD